MIGIVTVWTSTCVAICYALYLTQESVVLLAFLFPFFTTNSFQIKFKDGNKNE